MCVREREEAPHSSFHYILSLSPLFPHHYYTPKMSINHFSPDLPEAHWWSHYTMDSSPAKTSSPHPFIPNHNSTARFWLSPHPSPAVNPMFCTQTSTVSFDLNNEDDDEVAAAAAADEHSIGTPGDQSELEIPKERLFEKPLTPSDVGKLNRLVIPKQHAEKHFPLNGGGDSGENGLLLGFEDELGKSWRFRYSYWNSSQSYVLTKGWSRFVKEKRLDAGDIVVFARHRVDSGRLFIGWRRRNSGGGHDSQPPANGGGSGGWSRMYYSGHPCQIQQQTPSNSLSYPPESLHAGVQNQTTSSGSKRLRLFGVNLECQADESEPSTPVGSPMSSQGQAHQQPYYSSNHHMQDLSFSGGADVYRQG